MRIRGGKTSLACRTDEEQTIIDHREAFRSRQRERLRAAATRAEGRCPDVYFGELHEDARWCAEKTGGSAERRDAAAGG